ncbi:hypothetical protein LDC_1356 [sediment metagenome]|uniref:Uncharacterized protein n=1 Tax=sediment metagenome TaxID=749907 RepID=D9PIJ8_9ZZZZ
MAGLKTFWPNPPKTIFPSATPATIPTIAIQKGIMGGREREKIRDVTKTADVIGFPCLRVKRASVTMPKPKTTTTNANDRQPKRYTEAKTRGKRA